MTVPWARMREVARKHLAGILAGVAVVGLVQVGWLETAEHFSLGKLFEWRGSRQPSLPIVIVTIDESTFTEMDEQWPFARARHAELIMHLAEGQPRVIGVDLIFDAPSSRGPKDDEALGEAVAFAGNVVLGAAYTKDIQPYTKRETFNVPLPMLRKGAAGMAPVNMDADPDGHVRRVPVKIVPIDLDPMLAFDATMHALLAKSGMAVAPLPKAASVLINFRGGPVTYPWVSYHRVVRGEIPSSYWKDKIVLIGPTSEILHDQFPTPFAPGGNMPGVEIHANALETLVRGNPIREVPRVISTVLAVVAGLLGSALVVRLRALRALIAALALVALLTAGAVVGFAMADVWMRGMAGLLALGLGYGATVVEHFVREQRERRQLSRFFSPSVVKEVVRHKDDGSLTTARRLVTVLFSDIRGFTTLSEQLQPEQVEEMLREYLTEMTEIVYRHGGTVDKYIGDCVMALYNVPFEDAEHAVKAVRTGLEFQERTLAVSKHWEQKLGIAIRNGVGINTGDAVVGTLGSKQLLQYTAIGDTINLGARLESITKEYKSNIIISESTYELVKGQFVTKELGEVTVKGKTKPVKIYSVLPNNIRKHPRATLEAAATLTLGADGRSISVATRDISEGGMALKGVPEDWEKGQTVQIRCEGGALPKPIVAEATIAWRKGDEVGLTFTSLDPDSAPTVADYLSSRAK
ncbi:MAG TPA: CHASE2 domain-containing protein [Methylomirabilota bacterium]|jgi:adenylate cyclase|nr:CHASE2 domain-containing protein [Methylomirabilota bacterium]